MNEPPKINGFPAVQRASDHTYIGTLGDGWNIGEVPNGGYSGMFGLLAMLDASGREDPLTVTGHYLRPTAPGPIDVSTAFVKQGRTITTMTASMVQNGKEVTRFTGSFGELGSLDGPSIQTLTPPELPGPDECFRRPPAETAIFPPAFFNQVDARIPEGLDDFYDGLPAEGPVPPAELHGWIRHLHEPTTLADLFLFADAFPPPIFATGYGPSRVATIELTVHFRKRPTSDWIIGSMSSPAVAGGLQTEDGVFWDATGSLVAQSRQLALAPTVP